jgi:glutaredoxin
MPFFTRNLLYLGISSVVVVAGVSQLSQLPVLAQTNTAPAGSQAQKSSQAAIDLARHLTKINAKMYGAYWCPHCTHQREVFGQQAFALINYIECAPDGKNAQPELCKTEKIQGYPTWKINGKTYLGVHSLEELASLSSYQGSRNF